MIEDSYRKCVIRILFGFIDISFYLPFASTGPVQRAILFLPLPPFHLGSNSSIDTIFCLPLFVAKAS